MSGGNFMPATCFGKIPSRGDFVRGSGHHQLLTLLDRWVSRAMEMLSEDSRWKIAYDSADAVDFAFVGARSRVSVIGHLRPSSDSSGRRFPFITAAMVEREDSLMFRCGPAGLQHPFSTLAQIAEAGVATSDVGQLLEALDVVDCAGVFDTAIATDPLGNFVRHTTLEGLAEMLGQSDSHALRRIILAIGMLLRPVLGQAEVSIDKDIVLPLPGDERYRYLVAGLWLYLVSAFLRRTAVELQVIIERKVEYPRLVLGFNGAAASALLATLASDTTNERRILLLDPEWIEEQADLRGDYGIAKLSTYLTQPGISLEQAIMTFREVFLGE